MRELLRAIYRNLHKQVIRPFLFPFIFSETRRTEAKQNSILALSSDPKSLIQKRRIWFHAASVGELESLTPIIMLMAKNGDELILTILSESARNTLEKLRVSLADSKDQILYGGYSPWEGEWKEAFQKLRPHLFVTAKYEAWPDLWVSLRQLRIPLAMVSVHARKSLKIAKLFCKLLIGDCPELILFPCVSSEVQDLHDLFPQAVVQVVGEPRWDQVYSRIQRGSSRSKELIQVFKESNRPWGVIGSAWMEDLQFLENFLKEISGTLWIVPHQVEPEKIQIMENFLRNLGLSPLKTSRIRTADSTALQKMPRCILVDEMGFLTELYSMADWAYVGGGWGVGIHSTIEPAIQGIPVAVGPNGIHKFYEVGELTQSGQLKVLRTAEDLAQWKKILNSETLTENRKIWKEEAKSRLGATQKILSAIEKFLIERARLSL